MYHSPVRIWNTVSKLCEKESKFVLGLKSVGSLLNLPPNTCIPSKAKIIMNKKRRKRRDAIDWIELRRDATRFDSAFQYLVTLNTRSSRTHRSTETPIGGITCVFTRAISTIELIVAKQSKRLNNETKYLCKASNSEHNYSESNV